jgi:hypothetical protein
MEQKRSSWIQSNESSEEVLHHCRGQVKLTWLVIVLLSWLESMTCLLLAFFLNIS